MNIFTKNLRPQWFAMALVVACASMHAVSADRVTRWPVQFAKGASSASMKGSLSGYETVEYTLGARAGQTMTVKITGSRNANFNVFPPGASPGQSTALGSGYVGGDWTGTLPADGTYLVQVYQMRASARRAEKVSYTISFAIAGAGTSNKQVASAPVASGGPSTASGALPCAQTRGQPMGQCPFTVTREGSGTATVLVALPDGRKRAIFFRSGIATGADLSQADGSTTFSATKEVDLFLIRAGNERYEIPDVVVSGD